MILEFTETQESLGNLGYLGETQKILNSWAKLAQTKGSSTPAVTNLKKDIQWTKIIKLKMYFIPNFIYRLNVSQIPSRQLKETEKHMLNTCEMQRTENSQNDFEK